MLCTCGSLCASIVCYCLNLWEGLLGLLLTQLIKHALRCSAESTQCLSTPRRYRSSASSRTTDYPRLQRGAAVSLSSDRGRVPPRGLFLRYDIHAQTFRRHHPKIEGKISLPTDDTSLQLASFQTQSEESERSARKTGLSKY